MLLFIIYQKNNYEAFFICHVEDRWLKSFHWSLTFTLGNRTKLQKYKGTKVQLRNAHERCFNTIGHRIISHEEGKVNCWTWRRSVALKFFHVLHLLNIPPTSTTYLLSFHIGRRLEIHLFWDRQQCIGTTEEFYRITTKSLLIKCLWNLVE